jgi:hypothetical protein
MSLVLGLRIGEAAYVDDTPLRLDEIYSNQRVLVGNAKTGKSYDVSAEQACEVLPDVFIALGDRSTTVMARVSIDAPRNMKILHGSKYRQLQANNEAVRPPPSATADRKKFKVPADILTKARGLGIYGTTAAMRVNQMARLSTPVTMPGYNRRFQQYVLFVDQTDAVIAIDRLTDNEQTYYDSRHYDERRDDNPGL